MMSRIRARVGRYRRLEQCQQMDQASPAELLASLAGFQQMSETMRADRWRVTMVPMTNKENGR